MEPHTKYDLLYRPDTDFSLRLPIFTVERRTQTQTGIHEYIGEVWGGYSKGREIVVARLDAVHLATRVDTQLLIADEDPDGDIVLAWKEYIRLLEKDVMKLGNGIMLLQALSVHPNFRGGKIGLHLLKEFITAFHGLAECFMGRPSPLTMGKAISDDERAAGVKQLWRYYATLGFKRVRQKSPLNMISSTVRLPDIGALPWEGDL